MTKQQFLSELQSRLCGLPQADLDERLDFYSEMIDDRIEEGVPEEQAVTELGGIDEVVSQILADYPLSRLVREKVRPKRRLRGRELALLILGSPLWLPLLIAAFAVAISLYISLWVVVISLWAVAISLPLCAMYGIVIAVLLAKQGDAAAGAAALGMSIFTAGLAILMILGCAALTKGVCKLTKRMFLGIKTSLIGKENEI